MTSHSRRSSRVTRVKSTADDEVCGSIEQVRFASENGWCILNVKTDRGSLVTVCGTAPGATVGERVRCRGKWTSHPKYGAQFEAPTIQTLPPSTPDAIEKYLASSAIAGVGPHYAKKLVKHFGAELPNVLSANPVFLESVAGIGPERRQRIAESWHRHANTRDIMLFLHQHGLGPQRAAQIHRRYGERAVRTLRENPYRLAEDLPGIGFATADQIAQRVGLEGEHPKRLEAGVRAVLQRQALEGHCAVRPGDLITGAAKLLAVPADAISGALERCTASRTIVLEDLNGEPLIYLRSQHAHEVSVAGHVRRLQRGTLPWGRLDATRRIEAAEARAKLSLTASQFETLQGVLEHKLSVVTGGPGTGKTTIMRVLADILSERLTAIHLTAPTGRAARRLGKSTGRPATTIHSLLRGAPGAGEFGYNASNPLPTQAVLVDESSMVDLDLMSSLLEALPDSAALILIGDVDQLPSVGAGQVLHDLIESGIVAVHRLTENKRLSEASSVLRNAYRVNRGLPPLASADPNDDFQWIIESGAQPIAARVLRIVSQELPARGLHPLRDIQVLTPMRRGELGTVLLNQRLQQGLLPLPKQRLQLPGQLYFGLGDRLVQLHNNREAGVYNGDTGYLRAIHETDQRFDVEFDDELSVAYEFDQLDELSLAYAMTVHKSQGSEYPAVVIAFSATHYPLLSKRLLYTAMTRARRVYLVGEERAVHMALSGSRSEVRRTGLCDRLKRAA